jgi:AraC-like DNA-binding protein
MPSITVTRFSRSEIEAIDEAIKYIDRMFNKKINMLDLSETYNIPEKKLQAGIIKRTGLTIHGYIECARLHKAKELLADDAPLKSIAKLVGYRSQSQFGYFFKKHTGQTPLEYRKTIIDK